MGRRQPPYLSIAPPSQKQPHAPRQPSLLHNSDTPRSPASPLTPPARLFDRAPIGIARTHTPTPLITNVPAPSSLDPPPPSSPRPWLWQCHLCHNVWRLTTTRRCLADGHFFCSPPEPPTPDTATSGKGRRRKMKGCRSSFDYEGWEAYNKWRRSLKVEEARLHQSPKGSPESSKTELPKTVQNNRNERKASESQSPLGRNPSVGGSEASLVALSPVLQLTSLDNALDADSAAAISSWGEEVSGALGSILSSHSSSSLSTLSSSSSPDTSSLDDSSSSATNIANSAIRRESINAHGSAYAESARTSTGQNLTEQEKQWIDCWRDCNHPSECWHAKHAAQQQEEARRASSVSSMGANSPVSTEMNVEAPSPTRVDAPATSFEEILNGEGNGDGEERDVLAELPAMAGYGQPAAMRFEGGMGKGGEKGEEVVRQDTPTLLMPSPGGRHSMLPPPSTISKQQETQASSANTEETYDSKDTDIFAFNFNIPSSSSSSSSTGTANSSHGKSGASGNGNGQIIPSGIPKNRSTTSLPDVIQVLNEGPRVGTPPAPGNANIPRGTNEAKTGGKGSTWSAYADAETSQLLDDLAAQSPTHANSKKRGFGIKSSSGAARTGNSLLADDENENENVSFGRAGAGEGSEMQWLDGIFGSTNSTGRERGSCSQGREEEMIESGYGISIESLGRRNRANTFGNMGLRRGREVVDGDVDDVDELDEVDDEEGGKGNGEMGKGKEEEVGVVSKKGIKGLLRASFGSVRGKSRESR